MKKSDYLILLDNGHGVDTKGKRSPQWRGKPQLIEGIWTRDMVRHIAIKFLQYDIAAVALVPEERDVPLQVRCHRANIFTADKFKKIILLSIHGNAAASPQASGFEVFTSPGITEADRIAKVLLERVEKTKRFRMRYDTRHPFKNKEERFFILTNTIHPALLIEAGFYTNKQECSYMHSLQGRNEIAAMIVEGISEYITNQIKDYGKQEEEK